MTTYRKPLDIPGVPLLPLLPANGNKKPADLLALLTGDSGDPDAGTVSNGRDFQFYVCTPYDLFLTQKKQARCTGPDILAAQRPGDIDSTESSEWCFVGRLLFLRM